MYVYANRITLLTSFYRSSILEPLDTKIGVADWFEARFKMSKSAFSYAALIFNRRFKFRWAARFRLFLHVFLMHRLLIRFQFLGSLDVSQLLGDTQVCCYACSRYAIISKLILISGNNEKIPLNIIICHIIITHQRHGETRSRWPLPSGSQLERYKNLHLQPVGALYWVRRNRSWRC